jgi:hypothetical protein
VTGAIFDRFTPEERSLLRSHLLEFAAGDTRITGAAITGSAATGFEDRWSDIDLAFGVADASQLPQVLSDWTTHMYDAHGALHHLDVRAGEWIYRVFLLPGTLQVDLAFVPAREFRALAPSFRLVAGHANEPGQAPAVSTADLIGFGWLYGLHARTCLARGYVWQAEYMVSGLRDTVLALACHRNGLPVVHGRGFDRLPEEVTGRMEASFVRALNAAELSRAFRVAVEGLLNEIRSADAELGERLQGTLELLC